MTSENSISSEKKKWIDKSLKDLEIETAEAKKNGGKIHPLQLALDVQEEMKDKGSLMILLQGMRKTIKGLLIWRKKVMTPSIEWRLIWRLIPNQWILF